MGRSTKWGGKEWGKREYGEYKEYQGDRECQECCGCRSVDDGLIDGVRKFGPEASDSSRHQHHADELFFRIDPEICSVGARPAVVADAAEPAACTGALAHADAQPEAVPTQILPLHRIVGEIQITNGVICHQFYRFAAQKA